MHRTENVEHYRAGVPRDFSCLPSVSKVTRVRLRWKFGARRGGLVIVSRRVANGARKCPPTMPVVVPPDMIGGQSCRSAAEGRHRWIGSSLRLHENGNCRR